MLTKYNYIYKLIKTFINYYVVFFLQVHSCFQLFASISGILNALFSEFFTVTNNE